MQTHFPANETSNARDERRKTIENKATINKESAFDIFVASTQMESPGSDKLIQL
jgi:hypothetical protein